MLTGTQFGWSRNLRTGQDLQVRYKGKLRNSEVEVVEDEERVVELYGLLCKANHNFAKFHNIAIGAQGEPDPEGLRAAFKHGAKAILLTPKRLSQRARSARGPGQPSRSPIERPEPGQLNRPG